MILFSMNGIVVCFISMFNNKKAKHIKENRFDANNNDFISHFTLAARRTICHTKMALF